ncbi:MAG: heavy-metal-associated domain-containing protein [Acidiferrobacterales bacterium]
MIRIGATILMLLMLFAPLGAQAETNLYHLKVDGLGCPFCAYGIEKKLSAIDGVESIDVELKKGMVVVTTTEGAALTETQAHKAVKDAGFTLRAFSQIRGGE